jgi:MEMO1 family protein
LRNEIARCLAAVGAEDELREQPPKLLVVPHAGYVYSAAVAAHAYALLARWRTRITRVVLLGPAHRVPVHGLAAPGVAAFETPLGQVPIDRAAIADLRGLHQLVVDDRPHAQEHSLEVQLPFLQTLLAAFVLVPLVVGEASASEVAQVLEALWGGDETLVVISSDLSHYLSDAQARPRDRATVARMVAFATDLDPSEACGARPLNGALQVAQRRGLVPRLLDLRNSGDTAGDRRRVVGYAALAFDPPQAQAADAGLGDAVRAVARNAIARRLGLPTQPEPAHRALGQPGASFVTLHDARGQLRGCVGQIEPKQALLEDLRANAEAAAFRDPRFDPLARDEWEGLQLDVSLLEPLQPLPCRDEAQACAALRPGEDGVVLRWRNHQATLLPAVWRDLPQPHEFLAVLKRKAGLRRDFWADDMQLQRFAVRKLSTSAQ